MLFHFDEGQHDEDLPSCRAGGLVASLALLASGAFPLLLAKPRFLLLAISVLLTIKYS